MTLRCFIDSPLAVQQRLELPAATYHHALRVRRLQLNDQLILFNGLGGEYIGQLVEITKKTAQIHLQQFIPKDTQSPLGITLIQGIAKGEKMDFILQKSTELGVQAIQPLYCQYGVCSWSSEQIERKMKHWQQVTISACEQSGRCDLPILHRPQSLEDWLANSLNKKDFNHNRLLLSPKAHHSLNTCSIAPQTPIYLLIGPEGGLHVNEMALVKRENFTEVRLGPRILRTETAGLTALAILQAKFGDLT